MPGGRVKVGSYGKPVKKSKPNKPKKPKKQ